MISICRSFNWDDQPSMWVEQCQADPLWPWEQCTNTDVNLHLCSHSPRVHYRVSNCIWIKRWLLQQRLCKCIYVNVCMWWRRCLYVCYHMYACVCVNISNTRWVEDPRLPVDLNQSEHSAGILGRDRQHAQSLKPSLVAREWQSTPIWQTNECQAWMSLHACSLTFSGDILHQ